MIGYSVFMFVIFGSLWGSARFGDVRGSVIAIFIRRVLQFFVHSLVVFFSRVVFVCSIPFAQSFAHHFRRNS